MPTTPAPVPAPVTLTARAALFDMDSTLVDSGAVVERVWGRWAAHHGLELGHVMSIVHGRQGQESMGLLLPERSVAENLADNERMLAAETADTEGIVPIAGAGELLAAVADLPHALVTSADVPLSTARMAAAGLPMPALRITAEDVGASKPDPEGFLKAAEKLGIAPADCVVFEDSGAGVAAGLAAGMRVIGVGASAAAHGPTVTVPDLTSVTLTRNPDATFTLTINR